MLTPGATSFLSSRAYATTKPKAYLNWILFDEQFKMVESSSSAEQVGDNEEFKVHTKTNLPIDKNGYLYVYVSNETPNIDVFFDNLQLTHIRGAILEETHYYPFGFTMAGISSKAAETIQNKEKTFQGQRFDDDLGLNWIQFKWRNHDPQIGRFIEIDPLSDDYEYNSPYAFSENKVTGHVELEGLEALEFMKLIYDNVSDGLYRTGKWINDNLNPAVSTAELITGKSNESNFTEPKPRMESAAELGFSLFPGGKIEGAVVKTAEKVLVKEGVQAAEKQVVKAEARAEVKVVEAYKRPNNATTSAQRASVQGKPCVSCGEAKPKMVADHKTPLVKEHYQTGTIDKTKMKSTDAVQPQCPTCSAKQGAEMSQYSKEQKKLNGLQ